MAAAPNAARRAAPSRVASPARDLHPSVDASVAAGLSRPARMAAGTGTRQGTRTVGISSLLADGSTVSKEVPITANPYFDDAFSAFARGTLLQAPGGEIAVEDLRPGDVLRAVSGRDARVLWIGTVMFDPADAAGPHLPLVRIAPDSFGEGRPHGFLTLGPGARILHRPPQLRGQTAPAGLLTPVDAFVDAVNVVEISPPAPVPLYHVVLDRHSVIRAGGLDCESFHPGPAQAWCNSHRDEDGVLSLFPHLARIADFGPLAHPRAPETDF